MMGVRCHAPLRAERCAPVLLCLRR
jgi:hypothetical protein